MSSKWALVGGLVLLLCLAAIMPVLAQGPGLPQNPIYATLEYVDQKITELYLYVDQANAQLYTYVDEKIAGIGGGGEDFDLPSGDDLWIFHLTFGTEKTMVLRFGANCTWHDIDIGTDVRTRAVLQISGAQDLVYGIGGCSDDRIVRFENFPDLNDGDQMDLELSYWWMGISYKQHLAGVCQQTYYTEGPPLIVEVECHLTETTAR